MGYVTPSSFQAVLLVAVEGRSESLTAETVVCWVQLVASLFPSLNSLLVDSVGCYLLYSMIVMPEVHLVPVLAVWMEDLVVMTVILIPGLLHWC